MPLTPAEYVRYQNLKMCKPGESMTAEQFRASRKKQLSWMRDEIRGRETVADYGSGSGWLAEMCKEAGIQCFEMDEIAMKGALETAPRVDLLTSITCMEHQTPEEVLRFVDLAADRCRHLLIVTNNPKCMFSHLVLWDDFTHVRLYSETSIRALLEAKGWRIERVFYRDDVLAGRSLVRRVRRLMVRAAKLLLGPMFLGNTCNYWCVLAESPSAGSRSTTPSLADSKLRDRQSETPRVPASALT